MSQKLLALIHSYAVSWTWLLGIVCPIRLSIWLLIALWHLMSVVAMHRRHHIWIWLHLVPYIALMTAIWILIALTSSIILDLCLIRCFSFCIISIGIIFVCLLIIWLLRISLVLEMRRVRHAIRIHVVGRRWIHVHVWIVAVLELLTLSIHLCVRFITVLKRLIVRTIELVGCN